MNFTVVRFVGWIVLGLLTAALPIASTLLFRYNPRPRYVRRFYIWLAVALDCVAFGGALADANALGLIHLSLGTLGWGSVLLGVIALLTLALALWHLLVETDPPPVEADS